jgi:hypothetical protein
MEEQKSERWYKVARLWDQAARKEIRLEDGDVVALGRIPPEAEVMVCLVPTSITAQQGMALQKILEAQYRGPVLVLTNNVQLARLREISDLEAAKIMAETSNDDAIVEWPGQQPSERGGVRGEDRPGAESGPRPAGADGQAGGAPVGEGTISPDQVEPGAPERPGQGGNGA